MEIIIKEIIKYLEDDNGGEFFAGSCGGDFMDECEDSNSETCRMCRVAYYRWSKNKDHLNKIKNLLKG